MINIFNKFKDTILYSDGDTLEKKIRFLEKKLETANSLDKKKIMMGIRKYKRGLVGEKKIIFELMNSHIPMYILHDLNLEYKGYKAQIDFVVITCKNYYIIECKNLYGNMSIDRNGNFYRVSGNNKKAIYNPVTQVDRHIGLIREYVNDKNSFFGKLIVNRVFNNIYHGIVVLVNDETVISDAMAPRNIRSRVVRADKLVEYIKNIEEHSDNYVYSGEDIKNSADRLLALSVNEEGLDNAIDNDSVETEMITSVEFGIDDETVTSNDYDEDVDKSGKLVYEVNEKEDMLRDKLREYRLKKSRELNFKPYYIFNDATMYRIIDMKPKSIEDLVKIHGIGDKKAQLYGNDILRIISDLDKIDD